MDKFPVPVWALILAVGLAVLLIGGIVLWSQSRLTPKEDGMDRFLVPRLGFLVVISLATLLIYGIVLRSPDTHSNLWTTLQPDYARTSVAVVGSKSTWEGSLGRIAFLHPEMTSETSEPVDPGRRAYIQAGCARCHGLDARGGVVGPPLAGSNPNTVERIVREGPGGMPAFTEAQLSKADASQLAAYLQGLNTAKLSAEEIAALQKLTYDPSVPLALVLSGKETLRQSCGACHATPSKEQILRFSGDAEVASLVSRMAQYAKLSLEDAKAVAYYMFEIRSGAIPEQTASSPQVPQTTKPSPKESTTPLGKLTYDPSVPLALVLKGRDTLQQSCGACHPTPTKERMQRFSGDAELASLVSRMAQFASLSPEDAKAVAYYMLAVRNGADPDGTSSAPQVPQTTKPSTEESATPLEKLTYDPSVPLTLVLKGRDILQQSCGTCHAIPTKEQIQRFGNDAELASLVSRMAQFVSLSSENAKAVAYYMLAIRNGADPAK